jgi:uridine kinase
MNIKDLADSIFQKQSEVSVDRGFLVAVSGTDASGKGYMKN